MAESKLTHTVWQALLQEFVSDSGFVNYHDWKQKEAVLDAYLLELSENPPSEQHDENYQLSYWINAYNAFTVKLILLHYGVKSIKEISHEGYASPWKIPFFKIGGEAFTLDKIEHDILRVKYNEARIHFSIVCASGSCPILRNEAYDATKLHAQLEEQTQLFLNDATRNAIEEDAVSLSPILKWFHSDFKNQFQNSEETLAWLSNYTQKKIKSGSELGYSDFNWDLNGA